VALTKLTALATLPAQPTYCRFPPQVAPPVFSSPLSSSTSTAKAVAVGEVLGDEVAHRAHRGHGVPRGAFQ
jgi:hypothetical protein